MVCKLNKSLYGLKEVPISWYDKIDEHFLKQGFTRTKVIPTYITKIAMLVIFLSRHFVDNTIVTPSIDDLVVDFKENMSKIFDVPDLRLLQYLLGMRV
jgi:hypothetical protein